MMKNIFNGNEGYSYDEIKSKYSAADSFDIDILSNGFKIRDTAVVVNNAGSRYIVCAWAENPFPRSKAR